MESQRYLPVNRSSTHLSLIQPHLHCFMKLLILTEDDHASHSYCLVCDFHLLSPAPPQHTHVPRLQTFTPEGSAKHLCYMPQETLHGDQIWKSGHKGCPSHPGTQDSTPFNLMPQDHPVPDGDNDSSDEYCEETDTCQPWLTYYSSSNSSRTNLQV